MTAKWTVMVYMAGNNSLSSAATMNLEQMMAVGSNDDIRVAAFVKQRGSAPRHLLIGKGGWLADEPLADNTDSGDPQTVVDFARWAIGRAEADRYALVLWNHGGGWPPAEFDQLYTQVRGGADRSFERDHLAHTRLAKAVFSNTVKTIFALNNARERAICTDDASGHSLDTIEVGNVLGAVQSTIQRPIDLFGMDACLMSTIEVAAQVRNLVQVVVGSQETEPNAGWRYDRILSALQEAPAMDGPMLAKTIVSSYIDSFAHTDDVWPVTQSALSTAALDDMIARIDVLVTALRARLLVSWPEVASADRDAISIEPDMTDLRSFCEQLLSKSADPQVRAAASAVLDVLKPGGGVVAEGHLPEAQPYGGISLYMPNPLHGSISRYYRDLDFARICRWVDFLGEYTGAMSRVQPTASAAPPRV